MDDLITPKQLHTRLPGIAWPHWCSLLRELSRRGGVRFGMVDPYLAITIARRHGWASMLALPPARQAIAAPPASPPPRPPRPPQPRTSKASGTTAPGKASKGRQDPSTPAPAFIPPSPDGPWLQQFRWAKLLDHYCIPHDAQAQLDAALKLRHAIQPNTGAVHERIGMDLLQQFRIRHPRTLDQIEDLEPDDPDLLPCEAQLIEQLWAQIRQERAMRNVLDRRTSL
jgi:hypothetical protein